MDNGLGDQPFSTTTVHRRTPTGAGRQWIKEQDIFEVSESSGSYIRSVGKAMAMLELLASAPGPLRVGEIAKALGLSASLVSRTLATMATRDFVDQDERTGFWRPGLALVLMGNAAVGRRQLDVAALPVMADASSRLSHVCVARLFRGKVLILRGSALEAWQQQAYLTSVSPIHSTSTGKLLAAHAGEEVVSDALARYGMPRFTASTITDPARFMAELPAIRERGYAIDDGEIRRGYRHVACPIHDRTGRVVAAFAAGGPTHKLGDDLIAEFATEIRAYADRISDRLNYDF